MNSLNKPLHLKKGDRIAIAAASSHFSREAFEVGVAILKERGYQMIVSDDIFDEHFYLAGSDSRRAAELNRIFSDPTIAMIAFARGGYGMQRILPMLDFSPLHQRPKVIVGYSDITPLFSCLARHGVGGCFYGPTIAGHFSSEMPEKTKEFFFSGMESNKAIGEIHIEEMIPLKAGSARGPIIGGCLSLLSSSIGTAYDLPDMEGILLIEDVGEKVYRLDRMLTHLIHSGKLKTVRGIIFGSLRLPPSEEHPEYLFDIIKERLHDFPGPIVTHIPVGHIPFGQHCLTLPLGVEISLNTQTKSITFHGAATR